MLSQLMSLNQIMKLAVGIQSPCGELCPYRVCTSRPNPITADCEGWRIGQIIRCVSMLATLGNNRDDNRERWVATVTVTNADASTTSYNMTRATASCGDSLTERIAIETTTTIVAKIEPCLQSRRHRHQHPTTKKKKRKRQTNNKYKMSEGRKGEAKTLAFD